MVTNIGQNLTFDDGPRNPQKIGILGIVMNLQIFYFFITTGI